MSIYYCACSMVIGIFKKDLPETELENFRSLFAGYHTHCPEDPGPVFEGKNAILFCFPLPPGASNVDPMVTGGAPVVFFKSTKGKAPGSATFLHARELPSNDQKTKVSDIMAQLNGSWSAAWVDDETGQVALGRDIAGAQAMFYSINNGILYFASSLTLFRKLPFTINIDAISDFLHYLYIPAPRTIYNEVKSVLPGQIVSFDGKNLRKDGLPRRNFREDQPGSYHFADPEQFLIKYEDLLKKSVQKSCSKKGKTALFLSGGKDSSDLD